MDPLNDPLKDRRVKNVKPPPHKPLADKLMWKEGKSISFHLCLFYKVISQNGNSLEIIYSVREKSENLNFANLSHSAIK